MQADLGKRRRAEREESVQRRGNALRTASTRRFARMLFRVGMVIGFGGACSDGDAAANIDVGDPVPEGRDPTSLYSIKAYYGPERELIQFRAAWQPEADADGAASETVQDEATTPAVDAEPPAVDDGKSEATRKASGPGGEESIMTSKAATLGVTATQNGDAPGALLALTALRHCTRMAGAAYGNHRRPQTTDYLNTYHPQWSKEQGDDSAWFFFRRPPAHPEKAPSTDSCDGIGALQSVLLCAADEIAAVADTVSDVTWEIPASNQSYVPAATIVFPPQSAKDKFIARDVALRLLAQLGYLEFYDRDRRPSPLRNHYTKERVTASCTDQYAQLVRHATEEDSTACERDLENLTGHPAEDLYGSTHFKLMDGTKLRDKTDFGRFKALALSRLDLRVAVLRQAGLLVGDLVTQSFEEDMAGAQRAFSGAVTPALGLLAAWGKGDTGPYNSKRHAMDLLFGSLEFGGSEELSSWPGTASRSYIATGHFASRYRDVPASTSGEARAQALAEWAGIAASDALLNDDDPQPNQREHLYLAAEHRTRREFMDAGNEEASFEQSASRAALAALVDGFSDAEIRHALGATHFLFRALGSTDDVTDLGTFSSEYAGLARVDASAFPSGFSALVFEKGFSRGDLFHEPLAYFPTRETLYRWTGDFPPERRIGNRAFRNVFQLGDVLRQSLLHAQSVSELPKEVAESAGTGAAALTSWVGHAQVYVLPRPISGPEKEELIVDVVGLEPRDLNVAGSIDDAAVRELMASRLAVVYGSAYGIHCVTGQRTTCPSEDGKGYVVVASNPEYEELPAETSWPPASREWPRNLDTRPHWGTALAGPERGRFRFRVVPNAGLVFERRGDFLRGKPNPRGYSSHTAKGDGFYLVATAEAGQGVRGGRVLTAFPLEETNTAVISSTEREMARRILEPPPAAPVTLGNACVDPSAGAGSTSCVGIERNSFIPLANEITSEGSEYEDSWKHYLRVAEQAAARADELGRELIERGLANDEREEIAQSELGAACGVYVDPADISVNANGTLTASQASDAVQNCLNEPSYDLVFLGTDRYETPAGHNETPAELAIRIKQDAGCDEQDAPRHRFCDKDVISHVGLNPEQQGSVPPVTDCNTVLRLAEKGIDLQPSELAPLGSAEYVRSSRLRAALSPLALYVTDTRWDEVCAEKDVVCPLQWEVRRYGTPYMGTFAAGLPNSVYPHCLIESGGCRGEPGASLQRVFGVDQVDVESQNRLLERVQAALWQLGALGGVIPGGAFQLPVPAVTWARDAAAPLIAVYGDAPIIDTGAADERGVPEYRLASIIDPQYPEYGPSEASTLGTLRPASASYLRSLAAPHPPLWKVQLADHLSSQPAYLAAASNAAIAMPLDGEARDWIADLLRDADMHQALRRLWGAPIVVPTAPRFSPEISYGANHGRWICGGTVWEDLELGDLHLVDTWHAGGSAEEPPVRDVIPFASTWIPEAFLDLHLQSAWLPDRTFGVQPAWEVQAGTASTAVGSGSADEVVALFLSGGFLGLFSSSPNYDFGEDCVLESRRGGIVSGCHAGYSTQVSFATSKVLMPSQCTKEDRLSAFIVKDADDGGAATTARALALSCLGSAELKVDLSDGPPDIQDMEGIRVFEAWLDAKRAALLQMLNDAAFEEIPRQPVDAFIAQAQFSGVRAGGENGRLLATFGNDLLALQSGLLGIISGLGSMSTQVRLVRLELESLDQGARGQKLRLAREQIELSRSNAQAVVRIAVGAVSAAGGVLSLVTGDYGSAAATLGGATGGIASGVVDLLYNQDASTNVGAQVQLAAQAEQTSASYALESFGAAADVIWAGIGEHVIALQRAANGLATSQIELEANQNRAAFAAARAGGADFVTLPGAEESLAIPVNTVTRRLFGVAEKRYELALGEARRAAYVARLAIEQRLGVRLADLDSVGPLSPPHEWIENVCTASGINYDDLSERSFTSSSERPSGEDNVTSDFAERFIGDYVAQLRELVEFYNIEYPSKESDDIAVLSLREDLLPNLAACTSESPNELYLSDQLYERGTRNGDQSLRGWEVVPCRSGDDACLLVESGASVGSPVLRSRPWELEPLPPPDGVGGVSWLYLQAPEAVTLDTSSSEGPPAHTVYQTVPVRAGVGYELSWKDMKRSLEYGEFAAADESVQAYRHGGDGYKGAAPYTVTVYDDQWRPIETQELRAYRSTISADAWSERRSLTVVPEDTEHVHVAFTPNLVERGDQASVAIANVQFAAVENRALGYIGNGRTRSQVTAGCEGLSSEQLRSRFTRHCDEGSGNMTSCYWELDVPIRLDTAALDAGFGGLSGRVAAGNYNFRHLSTAINLVGTAVLDCTNDPNASCYGTGYVEYELEHDSTNAAILGHDGTTTCFDFGIGRIRSGKALATERYLTIPLGTADAELVQQDSIQRTEFRGRPLDGTYRLRIKESPALAFDRIEDVQLVMSYRYWSRVARPGTE